MTEVIRPGPAGGGCARSDRRRSRAAILPICAIVALQALSGVSIVERCYLAGAYGFQKLRSLGARHASAVQAHAEEPLRVARNGDPMKIGTAIENRVFKTGEAYSESKGDDALYITLKAAFHARKRVEKRLMKDNGGKPDGRWLVATPSWQSISFTSDNGTQMESKVMRFRYHIMNVSKEVALSTTDTMPVAGKANMRKLAGAIAGKVRANGTSTMSCIGWMSATQALKAAVVAGEYIREDTPEFNFGLLPEWNKQYIEDNKGNVTKSLLLHFLVDP
eukprot:TRINITY_DN81845_c0_g1_i1.p1 TRINITY_DN81845_c0_g1~~TRINITY_DN81845_c0_g1_i1.p1  ORF type:complete len:277 (+),score=35.66 TRINITY_DN81845_c0_g1_i1:92-922(+)